MTNLLIRLFIKNSDDLHSSSVRSGYGKMAGIVGIICNILLCIMKLIAGTLSGSIAITADAVNNLSDASSNIVSLLGFKLSEKPADSEHPYGHGRYEYLAGLFVCVLILAIGLELLKSSIEKILHPSPVQFSWVFCFVLLTSVLIKLWMMLFQKKIGTIISSGALIATSADSRNDAIATSAVLLATLFSHFISPIELDGYIGVAVAAFILYSGIGLIKDTISPLLGTAPASDRVKEIRDKILSYPGVLGTHDLMIHDYGPGRQFASVHVEMDAAADVLECHDTIDRIERDFLLNDNLHMIIHYDPVVTSDETLNKFRPWLADTVKTIHPDLTIHDVRMVPGPTHTNVIFDCCAPTDKLWNEADKLKAQITALVKETYPTYNCVITVDIGYSSSK